MHFCLPINQLVNTKSELMLMRRATAYNSFCSQLISVHLYPFRRTSLFSKIAQNHKNPLFFKVMQDHRCLYTINKHVTIAFYDNIAKF